MTPTVEGPPLALRLNPLIASRLALGPLDVVTTAAGKCVSAPTSPAEDVEETGFLISRTSSLHSIATIATGPIVSAPTTPPGPEKNISRSPSLISVREGPEKRVSVVPLGGEDRLQVVASAADHAVIERDEDTGNIVEVDLSPKVDHDHNPEKVTTPDEDTEIDGSCPHIRSLYADPSPSTVEDVELKHSAASSHLSQPDHESVDRFGFGPEEEMYMPVAGADTALERSRAGKWRKMAISPPIPGGDYTFKKHSKFIRRLYKGIPDCWRATVWYDLIVDLRQVDTFKKELHDPLLQSSPSSQERQIDMDVERTLRGHVLFQPPYGPGQRAMFKILRTISLLDTELGYCQGMSTVVALLIIYYPLEKAYIMLRSMLLQPMIRGLFLPSFPALLENFYVQEGLIRRLMPRLHAHFTKLEVVTMMYGTRWYCTLFAGGSLPFATVMRIWDVMMLRSGDGLVCTAIAILQGLEPALLAADFEGVLTLINSMLHPDEDALARRIRLLLEGKKVRAWILEDRKAFRAIKR